jgi:hypothetical protein
MAFLQRVLKLQAALWAAVGLAFILVPGTLLQKVFDIGALPDTVAFARLLGVAALVLAMLMVLVSQHAGEAWWWAWAFALLEAGIATIAIVHAVLGVPDGHRSWHWWLAGLVSIAFGALDLEGLAKAERSKPIA